MQDDFEQGQLSLSRWERTRAGDFAETRVGVVDIDPSEGTDYVLGLRANTIGTSDDTVKYLGVRSLQKTDFAGRRTVSFDLDWNNQANGSYLTAGAYLCPTATNANPRNEPSWLAFEYVGVPPGKNARFQVARKTGEVLRLLFTEGWPDEQRTGRKIANQHIELVIDSTTLRVMENGVALFATEDSGLDFTEAYLYLQMSSHSNYPTREVYFDNIMVHSSP